MFVDKNIEKVVRALTSAHFHLSTLCIHVKLMKIVCRFSSPFHILQHLNFLMLDNLPPDWRVSNPAIKYPSLLHSLRPALLNVLLTSSLQQFPHSYGWCDGLQHFPHSILPTWLPLPRYKPLRKKPSWHWLVLLLGYIQNDNSSCQYPS